MFMKKTFRYVLMAVLTVGLSLAVTSCKDDDNDNGNNGGTEAVDDQTSLEEYQLRSMMANFAGIDAADVVLTKTYEPEIGVVDDESKPNVRSIAVGTVEKADETAVMLLSSLGIDATNPAGFSYSSDMVGTVSYQHGGGDANTLATINLGLKQMPGLVQLRLTKTAGENANTLPRYKVGDIVKYKNHYWVCVFEAPAYKAPAYFVTFDHTGDLHATSTFMWTPSWSDKYWQYSTPMADATMLSLWLIQFVLNDNGWEKVKSNYQYAVNNKEGFQWKEEDLQQMVPTSIDQRNDFINKIYKANPDSDKKFVTYMVSKSQTNLGYANDDDDVWEDYDNGKGHLKVPFELLCNTTRYSENMRSNNQFWVPYLFLCPTTQANAFNNHLNAIPSQNTKKFTHEMLHSSLQFNSQQLQGKLGTNKVAIMTAARYWEHEYYDGKNWLLFDFTKDWRNFPNTQFTVSDVWISRCVTSKSMSIVDKGVTASGFTDVYVARDDDLENIEDGDFGDELKNKPDDETGVYQPGDMVEDETGTKWLCVWGAAHSIELGLSDKTAWFISFDNISNLNNMPQGVIEENDVVQLAVRFASAIYYTTSSKHNDILFKGAGQLGLWQSAYDNAGIDMSKMWVMRDSTWTFNSRGETRNSKTTSLFTNLAYRASDGTLRLLRTIADGTQGGTERNNCYDIDGKKHDMWQYLMYKRYEYYDPQQMRDLTNAEKGLGMTTWNIPWKMWDDKMNFGDLSIQEKVDKFAANDKWVTLPLAGKTNRQQPRTSANSDLIRWQNYMWSKNDKNFYNSNAKSMFNEPVLIMRLMKVNDQGGKRPYLKSQDGRKLKVVKMLDNEQMYVGIFNRIQNQLLKQYTSGGDLQSVYLDNEQYIMELN